MLHFERFDRSMLIADILIGVIVPPLSAFVTGCITCTCSMVYTIQMATTIGKTAQRLDYEFHYKDIAVNYTIWSTCDDQSIAEAIIFLGTVQIGRLPAWVAQHCPPNTIVVQGAPHWLTSDSGSDIPEFMYGFVESALRNTLKHFKPATAGLRVIADSQAAPGVLRLFGHRNYLRILKDMVLLQPLGLNPDAYAGTDAKRLAVFKKRVLGNTWHQLPSLLTDGRLRHNHRILLQHVSFGDAKSEAHYSNGLSHNAIHDLQKLYTQNQHIRIICGSHDRLFPANEIKAALARYNIPIAVETVAGIPHSPLATRLGRKLLRSAFLEVASFTR